MRVPKLVSVKTGTSTVDAAIQSIVLRGKEREARSSLKKEPFYAVWRANVSHRTSRVNPIPKQSPLPSYPLKLSGYTFVILASSGARLHTIQHDRFL
jgi:hypothetical protein